MRIPWYYFVLAFAGIGFALWWWLSNPSANRYPIEKAREAREAKALEKQLAEESPTDEKPAAADPGKA